MEGEVLVKARPRLQYNMSGQPSMYFERDGRGESATPTKRERLAGLAGGLVGVMGGLTGKHRSLGSLLGSMYAGKVQGEGIGRGLAGKTVSRARRAELKEQEDRLAAEAQKEGQRRFRERRPIGIRARNARMLAAEDEALARAGSAEEELRASQAASKRMGKIGRDFRVAQNKAERRAVSREDMSRARALRGMSPAQIERFKELDSAGLERLQAIAGILDETVNPYAQINPTVGEMNQQQVPQGTVQPLQFGPGAQMTLQAGEEITPEHADHNNEGLTTQLGLDIADEQEKESEQTMGLGQSEFGNLLGRMGPQ
jgi:hypothetical protein|tara:strand:- start:162 stop:1103 length:942 start_codon:yes stop_codon:yes gene_type:complete